MSHNTTNSAIRGRWRHGLSMVAAGMLAFTAACGRQGPPLPPVRLVPQPLTELRAAQRGARIEISYRVPAASVDGQRLPLIDVELFWTTEEGDLLRVAQRRARKAAPGERLIDVLDTLPPSGRTLRVSGRAHATRRYSTLASEVALRIQEPPPTPIDLSVEREAGDALLSWTAPVLSPCDPSSISAEVEIGECPSIAGYNVYRRAADERRVERLDETTIATEFRDTTAVPDKGWCYSVTTVISIEPLVESSPSREACVDVSLRSGSDISSAEDSKASIESQTSP